MSVHFEFGVELGTDEMVVSCMIRPDERKVKELEIVGTLLAICLTIRLT